MSTKYFAFGKCKFLGESVINLLHKTYPKLRQTIWHLDQEDCIVYNTKEAKLSTYNFVYDYQDTLCENEVEVTLLDILRNEIPRLIPQSEMKPRYWYLCPDNRCYYNGDNVMTIGREGKVYCSNNVSKGMLVINKPLTIKFVEAE